MELQPAPAPFTERRIDATGKVTGFAHAVAVVMSTRSYREGKKMYWDRKNERIPDRPVTA